MVAVSTNLKVGTSDHLEHRRIWSQCRSEKGNSDATHVYMDMSAACEGVWVKPKKCIWILGLGWWTLQWYVTQESEVMILSVELYTLFLLASRYIAAEHNVVAN